MEMTPIYDTGGRYTHRRLTAFDASDVQARQDGLRRRRIAGPAIRLHVASTLPCRSAGPGAEHRA